jgi:hypothetical protein
MKRTLAICIAVIVFGIVTLGACSEGGNIGPQAPVPTPTPCGLRCAPPVRLPANAQVIQSQQFNLTYTNDWSVEHQDTTSVVLQQSVSAGVFEAEVGSTSVPTGTSASQLLTKVEQQFDMSNISGATDDGPIYGAEIGYVAGAGDVIQGTLDQANAPSEPVYLEFMASTRGGTGIFFIAASTINPNAQNPDRVLEAINGEFDQLTNGVAW